MNLYCLIYEEMSNTRESVSDYKKRFAKAQTQDTEIKQLTDYEHVYEAPDIYMDSCKKLKRKAYLLDVDGFRYAEIDIPYAFERVMFIEILANSCDAMTKTVKAGFRVRPIEVTMTEDTIMIKNGGIPIPVRKNADNEWFPYVCFSRLKTGTSFNSHRNGSGRNGMGSTLCMLLCVFFSVNVKDAFESLEYNQEFRGPYDVSEPITTPYNEEDVQFDTKKEKKKYLRELSSYGGSFVEIVYQPDFTRFSYPKNQSFTEDMISLFRRNLADASFGCKTQVIFNNQVLDYSSINRYGSIFFEEDAKKIIHYIWPEGTKVIKNSDGSESAEDGLTLPDVEVMLVDCHRNATHVGLTNCVFNGEGGIHVDAALVDITKYILQEVNGTTSEKNKEGSLKIKPKDVRDSIGVIVSVRVLNAEFNGQPKSILRAYSIKNPKFGEEGEQEFIPRLSMKINIPKDKLAKVKEWDCVERFKEERDMRLVKILKSIDGKSGHKIGKLINGKDANWAGYAKYRHRTILLIYEGKSAGMYGRYLRDFFGPDGHNILGLLPTGGKIKNVSGMTLDDIAKLVKNDFFKDLKTMLGLQEEVDYTIPENFNKLRYQEIRFAGDSDIDGVHIRCLFANMLHVLYPSLLKAGVLKDYRSKLVTAKKGKQKKIFYQLSELREWEKTTDSSKWSFHYFKGLGSSDKKEVKEDFDRNFVVDMVYDDGASECFDIFFSSEHAATRRELIMDYNIDSVPAPVEDYKEDLSNFLENTYIGYCHHTLKRHLYKRDGLNEVRRKIIHAYIKTTKYWLTGGQEKDEERTAVVSASVTKKSYYHHGESLSGVLIKTSQTFVGSININYSIGHGQMGSRLDGGKSSASPRYTSLRPNNAINNVIFPKRFDPLLVHKIDEGHEIEPEVYYCPIPMALVQGLDAVMSGWKVYIPPHNFLDVCMYMTDLLNNEKPEPLVPWWRGFTGYCKVRENKMKEVDEEEEVEVEDEDTGKKKTVKATSKVGKYTVITRGEIEDIKFDSKTGTNSFTVTELPPGVWTETFIASLEKMMEVKKNDDNEKIIPKITSYVDRSTVDHPCIDVIGFRLLDADGYPKEMKKRDFPLERKHNLGTMMVLDDNEKPIFFETTHDIVVDYINWILPKMEKLRDIELKEMVADKQLAEEKIKYIDAVISGNLVLIKGNGESISRNTCIQRIRELGLNEKLYGYFKTYDTETIDNLRKECNKMIKKYNKLEKMTAKDILEEEIGKAVDAYINIYGNDSRCHN